MCKAFSCIVERNGTVHWKFGVDSHDELIMKAKLKDDNADPDKMKFARVEIAPKNNKYLEPDKWEFRIDQTITPTWLSDRHEKACWKAQKEWLAKLDKILIHKKIVHPFRDVTPPAKITEKHITLLREWDSVCDSVCDSVGDSVRASVWASVGASVWDSMGASVWDSVCDSVRAYIGSFFKLPRTSWKYTEKIKTKGYPFASSPKLWEIGLVSSFDGKVWRLHGGKDGKVLFEISKEELRKQGRGK